MVLGANGGVKDNRVGANGGVKLRQCAAAPSATELLLTKPRKAGINSSVVEPDWELSRWLEDLRGPVQ